MRASVPRSRASPASSSARRVLPAPDRRPLQVGRRSTRLVLPDDLVQAPALGEALEPEAAAVYEGEVLHRADERLDRLRDQDLVWLRLSLDVLCGVHRGPEEG